MLRPEEHCIDELEPSRETKNIIIFGENGVGKGSLINLLAGKKICETPDGALGCMLEYKRYLLELEDQQFAIWDTAGLDEGSQGSVPADKAGAYLKQFLHDLARNNGVSLLVYCVDGRSSVRPALITNYRIFYSAICKNQVPIAIAVTGLENQEGDMKTWWCENEPRFASFELHFDDHARVFRKLEGPPAEATTGDLQSGHICTTLVDHTVLPSVGDDSHPFNVIIFGEMGVGKSSVINLIAGEKLADTSPSAGACTFNSEPHHHVVLESHRPFCIWDTVGLNEPEISQDQYLRAVKQAYKLIKDLERSGGVHLLLLCMRGRITKSLQQNYKLFVEVLCERKVPLCIVVTNLENEPCMEGWWTENQGVFEKYRISADGHACITANPGVGGIFHDRFEESREMIRKLLLDAELELLSEGLKKDVRRTWLADLSGKMTKMVSSRHHRSGRPTCQELTDKLVNDCGFSRRETAAIARSIEAIRNQTCGNDEGPLPRV